MSPLHSSTGTTVRTLNGHLDSATSVQMLSDYRVVSTGADGMIFLWDGGGREREEKEELEDWIEKRKRPFPNEEESEEEFIPPILQNYLREGGPEPSQHHPMPP
jgi:WD40 repeat protein